MKPVVSTTGDQDRDGECLILIRRFTLPWVDIRWFHLPPTISTGDGWHCINNHGPVVETTVYTTFPRWGNGVVYVLCLEPGRVRIIKPVVSTTGDKYQENISPEGTM